MSPKSYAKVENGMQKKPLFTAFFGCKIAQLDKFTQGPTGICRRWLWFSFAVETMGNRNSPRFVARIG